MGKEFSISFEAKITVAGAVSIEANSEQEAIKIFKEIQARNSLELFDIEHMHSNIVEDPNEIPFDILEIEEEVPLEDLADLVEIEDFDEDEFEDEFDEDDDDEDDENK